MAITPHGKTTVTKRQLEEKIAAEVPKSKEEVEAQVKDPSAAASTDTHPGAGGGVKVKETIASKMAVFGGK